MDSIHTKYSKVKCNCVVTIILIAASTIYLFYAYNEIEDISVNFSKKPLIIINYDNRLECYENYAYDTDNGNQKYLLRDIIDDGIVQNTNGENIFFHNTDCIHDGTIKLRPRQACAVESSARFNPESQVFLTFAAQVGFVNETTLPLVDALLSYENVHINNLNVSRYVEGSPCEELWKSLKIQSSEFVQTHISDLLRLLSLYQFGGLYLDLDTMVTQNLKHLGVNYLGAGDDELVNNAIMNMSPDDVGHELASGCLEKFGRNYSPEFHNINGPEIVSDVLYRICNTNKTAMMTRENCDGYLVYPPNKFYAYDYTMWEIAFEEEYFDNFAELVAKSEIIHFSNYLTSGKVLKIDANVGYIKWAEKYCPRVYGTCTDEF